MKNKVLEAWFYIVVAMIFTGYSFYLFFETTDISRYGVIGIIFNLVSLKLLYEAYKINKEMKRDEYKIAKRKFLKKS
ncbi:TPA: hypothetical protein ACYX87_004992 [Klebsiella pneumoniae]|jgi:Na+/phosphate symporter|uniref:Uncharacterized protein n=2 Tax=Enterobacteriaceae TaxID=543 RepID=A0AB73R841_ECOLX|nr:MULTISPECIES: hypothetical protein [Enterobacterales]EAR7370858.1 hypothetical protein [Salmonella enterica]EBS0913405.1 hypothetical protein [Salmonella enterica subsp. enterica serovar Enteritidis]ECI6674460.1 hypothetical protein [Salmonella enterica subsp. enterica serovar Braenderup]EDW8179672.1 hypothetical protein [Salmonella enterica subsp. enterica serovar Mbandaka]EFP5661712.1 hypothetical protein [Salmonella enterica subsp. enterica serovar Schwarzengrund]ELT0850897.1 hypothetic